MIYLKFNLYLWFRLRSLLQSTLRVLVDKAMAKLKEIEEQKLEKNQICGGHKEKVSRKLHSSRKVTDIYDKSYATIYDILIVLK